MKTTTNSEKLRAVKARENLTYRQIAEHCGVSLKAVESWLCDPEAISHRMMPDRALDLLGLRLDSIRSRSR